ncbi:MAG: galactose-1-phosphate uridylyltransferase [Nitrospirae bacterium]|nr:MAG: galactose-1-phosphate uridylyltransferase [Nitrospirota bacterium]
MSELRWGPVDQTWVVVAPERAALLAGERETEPPDDPAACPLCPERVEQAAKTIARYPEEGAWRVRVVANRYPAFRIEGNLDPTGVGLYDRMNGVGAHEVVIETPDHDRPLASLPVEQIAAVLAACRDRLVDLRRDLRLRYVTIFKNRGRAAGALLSHGHTQIVATPFIPAGPRAVLIHARDHFLRKERCLFCDILHQERSDEVRVVRDDGTYVTFCPYASRHPFEQWIVPARHQHDYAQLTAADTTALAAALRDGLARLATVLDDPPYNLILKTAPSPHPRPGRPHDWATLELDYHWHLQLRPHLVRPAGFEWATGIAVNPTPPEVAADYLRRAG